MLLRCVRHLEGLDLELALDDLGEVLEHLRLVEGELKLQHLRASFLDLPHHKGGETHDLLGLALRQRLDGLEVPDASHVVLVEGGIVLVQGDLLEQSQDLLLVGLVTLRNEDDRAIQHWGRLCNLSLLFLLGRLQPVQLQAEGAQRRLQRLVLPQQNRARLPLRRRPARPHHQAVLLEDVLPDVLAEVGGDRRKDHHLHLQQAPDHVRMHVAVGQDRVLRAEGVHVEPRGAKRVRVEHPRVCLVRAEDQSAELVLEDFVQEGVLSSPHRRELRHGVLGPIQQSGQPQDCLASDFPGEVRVLQGVATVRADNSRGVRGVSLDGLFEGEEVAF
mmetsp:Transcript_92661/g.265595  ORF Transcript_92661/g.265595 Transcript_92661/m.265595 type:complete len:331 (-) Transcript_92661:2099-3091(-)